MGGENRDWMNWNCVTFLQMEGGTSLVTETWPNYRFPHEKTGQSQEVASVTV